ncbi:imidazole glycerol phosphate synthase subunit HisH [uncultured Caulobacter sp.]|uniref:imidazole glycerol phosphate synthase subunit HisH n=1 Tax=uncultured Caulobacter sp. TaxID=158749 RepID=UPI002616F402|nr:imidazole glycerol phosphate synthase subunit HisH [uncultured Caulobacter sp.]
MQTVALIDYGSGNLRSAEKALREAARRRALDADIVVTADPDLVAKADRVFLPGVGAFASCRAGLDATGVYEAMNQAVHGRGVPFMGICVGHQLLATEGLEFGVTPGLDWIHGQVKKLEPNDPSLTIPHMGWNDVLPTREDPLFKSRKDEVLFAEMEDGFSYYFVHSFHATCAEEHVLGSAFHGRRFPAIVRRGNIYGAQFHPEKSHKHGMRLLKNFAEVA